MVSYTREVNAAQLAILLKRLMKSSNHFLWFPMTGQTARSRHFKSWIHLDLQLFRGLFRGWIFSKLWFWIYLHSVAPRGWYDDRYDDWCDTWWNHSNFWKWWGNDLLQVTASSMMAGPGSATAHKRLFGLVLVLDKFNFFFLSFWFWISLALGASELIIVLFDQLKKRLNQTKYTEATTTIWCFQRGAQEIQHKRPPDSPPTPNLIDKERQACVIITISKVSVSYWQDLTHIYLYQINTEICGFVHHKQAIKGSVSAG